MTKLKIYTATPMPFYSVGMEEWVAFTRDMFLQCRALQALGYDSKVVLLDGPKAQQHKDIIRATMEEMSSADWWRNYELDMVLLGAWAMPEYTPIAQAIKLAGVKLVVRCDSSGKYSQFGRPLSEVFLENFWSLQERFSNHLLRSFAAVAKTLIGYSPWAREHKVIEHMSYADLICIESPGARDLLIKMLMHRKRSDLANKVHYIAHPVKLPELAVSQTRKKQIICIGRWGAYPKNTGLLIRSLVATLRRHPDYVAVLVGGGVECVETELARVKCTRGERERINISGIVPHDQVLELCNESRINFVSSRWESFNIAAAEALCMGCSIVGPSHIASMRNFAGRESGTLGNHYSEKALADALSKEIVAWGNGERDGQKFAVYWRGQVSAESVSEQILAKLDNGVERK